MINFNTWFRFGSATINSIFHLAFKQFVYTCLPSLPPPSIGARYGVRHLQTLLLFFGLTIAYAMRVNLSVAVIAMSDSQGTNPDFEEYKWDERIQSWLLSSFFIGYVFTQVPAGKLAQRYGAKSMLAYSIGLCAILNILTPYAARLGDWKAVMVLRALEGLCQGFLFPSTHTLLSKWAPVEERGKLGTYCYTGMSTLYLISSPFLIPVSPSVQAPKWER